MKTKKVNVKLTLNKVTITDLKTNEMTAVYGGIRTNWVTCGATDECWTGYWCTRICECTDYPCTMACPI